MLHQTPPREQEARIKTYIVKVRGNKTRTRSVRIAFQPMVANHFAIPEEKLVERQLTQDITFAYTCQEQEFKKLISNWKRDYSIYPIDYDEVINEDDQKRNQRNSSPEPEQRISNMIQKSKLTPGEQEPKNDYHVFQKETQSLIQKRRKKRGRPIPRNLFIDSRKNNQNQQYSFNKESENYLYQLGDYPQYYQQSQKNDDQPFDFIVPKKSRQISYKNTTQNYADKDQIYIDPYTQKHREPYIEYALQPNQQFPQQQLYDIYSDNTHFNYDNLLEGNNNNLNNLKRQKLLDFIKKKSLKLNHTIVIQEQQQEEGNGEQNQPPMDRERSRNKKCSAVKSLLSETRIHPKNITKAIQLPTLNQTDFFRIRFSPLWIDTSHIINSIIRSSYRVVTFNGAPKTGKSTTFSMIRYYFETIGDDQRIDGHINIGEQLRKILFEGFDVSKKLNQQSQNILHKIPSSFLNTNQNNSPIQPTVISNIYPQYQHFGQYTIMSLSFKSHLISTTFLHSNNIYELQQLHNQQNQNKQNNQQYSTNNNPHNYVQMRNYLIYAVTKIIHKLYTQQYLYLTNSTNNNISTIYQQQSNKLSKYINSYNNNNLSSAIDYQQVCYSFSKLFQILYHHHGHKIIVLIDDIDWLILKVGQIRYMDVNRLYRMLFELIWPLVNGDNSTSQCIYKVITISTYNVFNINNNTSPKVSLKSQQLSLCIMNEKQLYNTLSKTLLFNYNIKQQQLIYQQLRIWYNTIQQNRYSKYYESLEYIYRLVNSKILPIFKQYSLQQQQLKQQQQIKYQQMQGIMDYLQLKQLDNSMNNNNNKTMLMKIVDKLPILTLQLCSKQLLAYLSNSIDKQMRQYSIVQYLRGIYDVTDIHGVNMVICYLIDTGYINYNTNNSNNHHITNNHNTNNNNDSNNNNNDSNKLVFVNLMMKIQYQRLCIQLLMQYNKQDNWIGNAISQTYDNNNNNNTNNTNHNHNHNYNNNNILIQYLLNKILNRFHYPSYIDINSLYILINILYKHDVFKQLLHLSNNSKQILQIQTIKTNNNNYHNNCMMTIYQQFKHTIFYVYQLQSRENSVIYGMMDGINIDNRVIANIIRLHAKYLHNQIIVIRYYLLTIMDDIDNSNNIINNMIGNNSNNNNHKTIMRVSSLQLIAATKQQMSMLQSGQYALLVNNNYQYPQCNSNSGNNVIIIQ